MYKSSILSLIILLLTSSCIVSKKQFDDQSAKKEKIRKQLFSTRKELLTQKESHLKMKP